MKTVACALAFAALGANAGDTTAAVKTAASIEPELDPETHKEWEKDYPIDVSHRLPLNLPFPYPAVQKSDTFDKDYVKDENNNKMDRKTWDEQLKYGKAVSDAAEEVDKLKNKLEDLEKQLKEAQKKADEEDGEYSDAKKKEDELGPAPDDFKEDDAGKIGDAVEIATEEVEKEMSDLEKCKEELRKAKEALQKLHEEADAAHLAEETKENTAMEAVKFERVADDLHDKAKDKVEEEKDEYDKAVKTYAEEKAILEKMEAELKTAEETLRKFRGGAAPAEPTPSGASAKSNLLASAVLLLSLVYTSSA